MLFPANVRDRLCQAKRPADFGTKRDYRRDRDIVSQAERCSQVQPFGLFYFSTPDISLGPSIGILRSGWRGNLFLTVMFVRRLHIIVIWKFPGFPPSARRQNEGRATRNSFPDISCAAVSTGNAVIALRRITIERSCFRSLVEIPIEKVLVQMSN